MLSESILVEYQLRSFSPWLASISLDVAVGGDVVQDPAQAIFVISKNPYSTAYGHFEFFYTKSVFAVVLCIICWTNKAYTCKYYLSDK
jgi:hypothetical protein